MLRLTVETEQETDGRWIAEVLELPGCLAYGGTEAVAVGAVRALAFRILADKVEHAEIDGAALDTVRFVRREPVAL